VKQDTGEWKILNNEEVNDLFSSPNNIQVIKWRRKRWARHVEHMGETRGAYRVLVRTYGRQTTCKTQVQMGEY
jgi:hypothetical protein